MGQSMGAILALEYLFADRRKFSSVVLTAPALGLAKRPNLFKVFFGRLASHILPRYLIDNSLDISGISRDPKVPSV